MGSEHALLKGDIDIIYITRKHCIVTCLHIGTSHYNILKHSYNSCCRSDDGPQYTGVYAVNNELQNARRLFEGQIIGPESFEVDKNSKFLN